MAKKAWKSYRAGLMMVWETGRSDGQLVRLVRPEHHLLAESLGCQVFEVVTVECMAVTGIYGTVAEAKASVR